MQTRLRSVLANDVWKKIDHEGFMHFHEPRLFSYIDDPVLLSTILFGKRPVRYQKTIIEPNDRGSQISLPKSMIEGVLHNDCMQYGLPAHMQVMMCERQAESGGGTYLLDSWPVVRSIQQTNPDLFSDLFTKLRRVKPFFQKRYSLTLYLSRGNLVFFHPGLASDAPVGTALQTYIDAADKCFFVCQPGDIYINNNHRYLHGREAFNDKSRRFVRILYWFLDSLSAPEDLKALASVGTRRLASKFEGNSFWLQHHFGVEAPELSTNVEREFRYAVESIVTPKDTNSLTEDNFRQVRLQEAVLSAFWQVLNESDITDDEIQEKARAIFSTEDQ